jgi:hypothetical protein
VSDRDLDSSTLAPALRPFVDGLSGTEAAKMIDRKYGGLNPIQITITKFQFQAACDAIKPKGGKQFTR